MRPHLRFAVLPLLLFACTPSDENRGCQVDVPDMGCFGSDPPGSSGSIALDSVAHVSAPSRYEGKGDIEVQVTTDKPEALRVVDQRVTVGRCSVPTVRVKALREGASVVRFTLPDGTVTSTRVTVLAAKTAAIVPFLDDTVKGIHARGGETLPVAETKEIVQVAGGQMIWRVVYSGGAGETLRGRGATTYTIPEGTTSTLVENDNDVELFELTTTSAGPGAKLELRAASTSLEVPVRVVPPDAVSTIRLFVEDDAIGSTPATGSKADAGASKIQRHVLARALDAKGATVYGAPFTFTLGAEAAPPDGQLLTYDFDPSAPKRPLVVTVVGSTTRAETTLSAATPANLIRSNGRELVNCSFGYGLDGASSFASAMTIAGLVLGLRRRRSRAAA